MTAVVIYHKPDDPDAKREFENRLELLIRKNERRVKRISEKALEVNNERLEGRLIYEINSMGGKAISYGWDLGE